MYYPCRPRARSAFGLSAEIARSTIFSEPSSSLKNFLTTPVKFGRGSHIIPSVSSHTSEAGWNLSNEKFYERSLKERLNAKKLKDEANKIVKCIDFQTKQRHIRSNQKLVGRIASISQWRDELAKEILYMKNQRFELDNSLAVLEKLYQATVYPLQVSTNCIRARRKRIGIDASKDNVEISLTKEIEIVKKWQWTLKGFINKAEYQNKANKTAQEACERDLKNKTHAQQLDDELLLLHDSPKNIHPLPGSEGSNLTMSHPLSWSKYTYNNIDRSQKERDKSQKLRNEMSQCFKACIDDIVKQYGIVNCALKTRIQSLTKAKNNFEIHLQQVKIQIQDQGRMAEILKKAISDKETPMKVAQTRLSERNKRIDMELCHDSATTGLQNEILGLREAMQTLKSKLHSILQSIGKLRKNLLILEQEIGVKDNSLEIDYEICLHMRKDMIQGLNQLPGSHMFQHHNLHNGRL